MHMDWKLMICQSLRRGLHIRTPLVRIDIPARVGASVVTIDSGNRVKASFGLEIKQARTGHNSRNLAQFRVSFGLKQD